MPSWGWRARAPWDRFRAHQPSQDLLHAARRRGTRRGRALRPRGPGAVSADSRAGALRGALFLELRPASIDRPRPFLLWKFRDAGPRALLREDARSFGPRRGEPRGHPERELPESAPARGVRPFARGILHARVRALRLE